MSDMFQSGALTCLICISSVRRSQAVRRTRRQNQPDRDTRSALPLCVQVWSCSSCFSLFHLPCIQKWARDSAFLASSVTDDDFGQRRHPWPWWVAFTAAPQRSHTKYLSGRSSVLSAAPSVEQNIPLRPRPPGMLQHLLTRGQLSCRGHPPQLSEQSPSGKQWKCVWCVFLWCVQVPVLLWCVQVPVLLWEAAGPSS